MSEYVHLCLTDLLDNDLTSYEYFYSLPSNVRNALFQQEISTFDELVDAANRASESPFVDIQNENFEKI